MQEYRRLCRYKDHIKMDLKEIGVNVMNWMELFNAETSGSLMNADLVIGV